MPTWQRFYLQASAALALCCGMITIAAEIGSHNDVRDAVRMAHAQESYAQEAREAVAYNQALAGVSAKPLSGNDYALRREVIGKPLAGDPAKLFLQAKNERDERDLAGSFAVLGGMGIGLAMPVYRRRRLSDDLSDQWDHELIYGDPTPPICDLSAIHFSSVFDELDVVRAEMPAEPQTYLASSYYQAHPELVTDTAPSFHPIRSLRHWFAARRERIAEQINPDNHVYSQFRLPLNSIEPIQFDVA